MNRLLALSIALALSGLFSVPATHAADTPAGLRALLQKGPATPAPGCALAVFREGRMQSLVADGLADIELVI